MSGVCPPREPPKAPQRDSLARSFVQARIAALDAERAAGLKLLAELESRMATLRAQLLRIDGACQALQELLAPPDGDASLGHAPGPDPTPNPASPALSGPDPNGQS